MKESLIAIMPTPSTLYQQGAPLRVIEASIISSATRNIACSSSVHQPRTEESLYSSSLRVFFCQQNAVGIRNCHPTIVLAANGIMKQILLNPIDCILSNLSLFHFTDDLRNDYVPENRLEIVTIIGHDEKRSEKLGQGRDDELSGRR